MSLLVFHYSVGWPTSSSCKLVPLKTKCWSSLRPCCQFPQELLRNIRVLRKSIFLPPTDVFIHLFLFFFAEPVVNR